MTDQLFRYVCPLRECNHETGPMEFQAEAAQAAFIEHLGAPMHPDGRNLVALAGYLQDHHDWLKTFALEPAAPYTVGVKKPA